jgi:hypothetical protein
MRHLTSYDENGPLIALGQTSFSAETGLPGGLQTFEAPTFLVASDESKIIVAHDGMELTDFGTFNDHYGFGSSPETALYDAAQKIKHLEDCNVDVTVLTKLILQPCIPSSDKPFYCGAQRVNHIPMSWRHLCDEAKASEEEFAVWQNGEPTDDLGRFIDRIIQLAENDAAPERKGDLRTIFSRKKPATPATFLRLN